VSRLESREDQVAGIAQELFAAMVDGGAGGLTRWNGPAPRLRDPLHAWVDTDGRSSGGTPSSPAPAPLRTAVSAGGQTCWALARALLASSGGAPLTARDVGDALGELANIIGGGVKSLMPGTGALTPPRVGPEPPAAGGEPALEVGLEWHGDPIVVSLWGLTDDDTEEWNR